MPAIRGMVSGEQHMVGHFTDSDTVLEFVNSKDMTRLAALGTSCPDHFLRTKICPLVVDFDPANPDIDTTLAGLPEAVTAYREGYKAYYDRCKHDNSPALRDPNAVVYLVPGVGMITFAKDKATARISGEFYVNAINVMRGADAVSEYQGLPEQEAFDIEYWLLEEAKLQRMPAPKSLAGRVALRVAVGNLRLDIQNVEYALGRCEALLKGRVQVGDVFHRLVGREQGREERRHFARRHRAVDDLRAAIEDRQRHCDAAEGFHQRAADSLYPGGFARQRIYFFDRHGRPRGFLVERRF